MQYDDFLSRISRQRKPSPIRALQPLVSLPGMISLGGGMPNPASFPFESLVIELRAGVSIRLSPEETHAAQQYMPTPGYPPFQAWLRELMQQEHAPSIACDTGWDVTITTGSQDALSKSFEMLLNPGDAILIERPTYPGALSSLRPLGARLVPVATDGDGLLPTDIDRILTNWDEATGLRPKVLYAITEGQNPSGSTLCLSRRHELLAVARKHNLLILEDSPYYYLQFGERLPSLFSLDRDGRVLRFDSLSKVLSAGARLGWATGPLPLIERIRLHMQASSLHASGISQVVVAKLLVTWGRDGLEAHVRELAELYRSRCDEAMAAFSRHLQGRVEVLRPQAGMFLWLRLCGIDDTDRLIKEKAVQEKVLLVPGRAFDPADAPSPFVRASFSTATPEHLDEAARRLARLLGSA